MKDAADQLRMRIDQLKRKIEQFKPRDEKIIREEIRKLYVDVLHSFKMLNGVQGELRMIAEDFKKRKSSQTEVGKFYSFVKSQTSTELDLATLLDRAWNLIVMEDYDGAIGVLKKVLDIDPKNIKGLGFMALALMDKALYDGAMLYLQQVLLCEPDNPFALNNLGYICYKKGIWGEAIEHLTKAAKQTKDRTAALYANYYLGLLYYERSMIPDAIRFFKQALKLGPHLMEAYYYLGLSEMKRYEFKKAVEYFEECIKIDNRSKYAQLCEEELAKVKPLIDVGKIFKQQGNDEPDKIS